MEKTDSKKDQTYINLGLILFIVLPLEEINLTGNKGYIKLFAEDSGS